MARHRSTNRMHATLTALSGALAIALVVPSLAGCPASSPADTGFTVVPNGSTALIDGTRKLREAGGSALIQGDAKGPTGLVGANIVANNGSSVISNNGSSIVAGNSSRYTVQSLQEDPIPNAIVYLTDPEERFFALRGQPVTATTDAKGAYRFLSGLPTDQVIIVNVMLADNRREVGFTVAKAGKNVINVSLATTYVTEFLRDQAGKAGKKMADYDLSQLAQLTTLTQQALDAGDLATPDLAIGKIADMNQTYSLAVGENKQGLSDAWAKLLGKRVLALTTLAGSGESGSGGDKGPATKAQLYKPKGIALDRSGNYYIADEGNHEVRKIAPDGTITTFAGLGIARFSGDGGPSTKAGLWWPRDVSVGPDGNLYIADTLNERIRKVNLGTGIIETWAGNPDQANGSFLNDFGGDGGPASDAKFAGVRGMAWDSKGGLIFADTWKNDGGNWNHIRRIDPDGTITSLVGVDGKSTFNGDGLPGNQTQIDYVQQVYLDAQDNIYFADANNFRVRKYDSRTKIVTTIVGTGHQGSGPDGKPGTETDLNSPYGVAVDKQGDVFFTDRGARLLRVLQKDGTVRTLAGGGTFSGDGEAQSIVLSEPHDIFMEPDGNLLFADSRAARVRRLWLKWGM